MGFLRYRAALLLYQAAVDNEGEAIQLTGCVMPFVANANTNLLAIIIAEEVAI
jgi:hypothetical protein